MSNGLPRAPAIAPPGRRRRPRWALAGVAVLAVGGLLGAALYSASGDRLSVIGIAAPVAYGETVQADDLVEVGVAADPLLSPVLWTDVDLVVGMTAATDLTAGSLLTMAALTTGASPGAGQELVPIALTVSQLPAGGLRPRDELLLVATDPAAGALTDPRAGAGVGEQLPATVLRVGPVGSTGVVVVDVLVDSGDGPALAVLAAAGRVAVVVLPRDG
ncbi:MAG: SAF domain-containing protein [Mycobacteriales bacterium]